MEHRKIATIACPQCGHGNAPGAGACAECGEQLRRRKQRVPAPDSISPGSVVKGTYRVIEFVGEGGAGTVYRGEHVALGNLVAVKRLSRKLIADEGMRRRFHEEGQIQANLNHPNIVRVTDLVDDGDLFAIIMEYIEGISLDGWLAQRRGPPNIDQAVDVLLGLLDGVGYAHERGIVHRDLKPANVMVARIGGKLVPKVTDFGIAKIVELARHTETGTTMGTIYYAAPEQLTDAKSVDRRADIYSLGCTFFEMVTGRLPFESDNIYAIMKAHIEAPRPKAIEFNPDVPQPVSDVIRRAMAKAPERRFQTCAEFADAIREATGIAVGVTRNDRAYAPTDAHESTPPTPSAVTGPDHRATVHTDLDLALRAPATSHRLTRPDGPRMTTSGATSYGDDTPAPPARRRRTEPAQIIVLAAIIVLGVGVAIGAWMAIRGDGATAAAVGPKPDAGVEQAVAPTPPPDNDADLVAADDVAAEPDIEPPPIDDQHEMPEHERIAFCRDIPERYVSFELVGRYTADQAISELEQWQSLNCGRLLLGTTTAVPVERKRFELLSQQVLMSYHRIQAIHAAARGDNACVDARAVANGAVRMVGDLVELEDRLDLLEFEANGLREEFLDFARARHEEMVAEYGGPSCVIDPMPEALLDRFRPQHRRIVAQQRVVDPPPDDTADAGGDAVDAGNDAEPTAQNTP